MGGIGVKWVWWNVQVGVVECEVGVVECASGCGGVCRWVWWSVQVGVVECEMGVAVYVVGVVVKDVVSVPHGVNQALLYVDTLCVSRFD